MKIWEKEIKTVEYNEKHLKEEIFTECPDINTTWIRITHLSSDKTTEKLFKCLNLNDYVLKKVFRLDFIPDIEDYKNYIYFPLTAFISKKTSIKQLQVSLILGENYVISIHYDDAQIFNSVMNRLNIHEHQIRNKGDDYLAYTFIDTIFDSHNTLKELEGKISKLAEKIMNDPSTDNYKLIQAY